MSTKPASKPTLKLDWCSRKAATFAVRRWHYSRQMPAAKLVMIGAWEDQRFVGVVIFGCGANRHIAHPFGLDQTQVCELVRVALAPVAVRRHPTSKILAIALRILHRQYPRIRVAVSYADSKEGHLGTIYQATNWIYVDAIFQPYYKILGRMMHARSVYEKYGKGHQRIGWLRDNIDPNATRVDMPAKHKYVWAFDAEMRRKLTPQAKPYPKQNQSVESSDGAVPGDQPGEGGSTPTSTLQLSVK